MKFYPFLDYLFYYFFKYFYILFGLLKKINNYFIFKLLLLNYLLNNKEKYVFLY